MLPTASVMVGVKVGVLGCAKVDLFLLTMVLLFEWFGVPVVFRELPTSFRQSACKPVAISTTFFFAFFCGL
jgi:hypothetical protein